MNLQAGRIYWVRGQGPMRLMALPQRAGETYRTKSLHGLNYWASEDQLSEWGPAFSIEYYIGQLQSRNLATPAEARLLRRWWNEAQHQI